MIQSSISTTLLFLFFTLFPKYRTYFFATQIENEYKLNVFTLNQKTGFIKYILICSWTQVSCSSRAHK